VLRGEGWRVLRRMGLRTLPTSLKGDRPLAVLALPTYTGIH
jgi:hypothetical protein